MSKKLFTSNELYSLAAAKHCELEAPLLSFESYLDEDILDKINEMPKVFMEKLTKCAKESAGLFNDLSETKEKDFDSEEEYLSHREFIQNEIEEIVCDRLSLYLKEEE